MQFKGIDFTPIDPGRLADIPKDVPILFRYNDGAYEVHTFKADQEYGEIVVTHEGYAAISDFSHYAVIEPTKDHDAFDD